MIKHSVIYMSRIVSKYRINAISATFIVLAFAGACSLGDKPRPYSWPPVSPEVDSLTVRIDRGLALRQSPDLLLPTLDSLMLISDATPENSSLRRRALLLRGMILYRMGEREESDKLFDKVLESTDSSSEPYLYNRAAYLSESYTDASMASFRKMAARKEYFDKQGDLYMRAALNISEGNFLKTARDPEGAFRSYTLADSLARLAGLSNIARNNGINRANALFIARDTLRAVGLLRDLLRDPVIYGDTALRTMVLTNLFVNTRDGAALKDLVALKGEEVIPMALAFMGREALKEGKTEEGMRMARAGFEKGIETQDADGVAWSMYAVSDAFAAKGQLDSAYVWLKDADDLTEEISVARESDEMRQLVTGRMIAEERARRSSEEGKHLLRVAVVAFCVFVLVIIAAGVVVVRFQKMRLARMEANLRREEAQRRLMATQILLDEKEALIQNLDKEVDGMERRGEISAGAKGKMSGRIHTHLAVSEGHVSFIEAFSQLHPDFTRRLRKASPDITESDIRLACYIAVGLDTKQLASTLGIRPESVKQARWRLRQKLGVSKGESLEVALDALQDVRP